jgi:tetratricopeptide (TPR) repeat protein
VSAAADSVDRELTVDEKIAELNRQILANPRDGRLYNNLGVLYAEQENWSLARDAFIAAVQANPVDADYHLNLGHVFLKLEQYDLAVREFEAYQKFDALGAPDAPRLIGEAWRSAGQTEQARESFEEGIKNISSEPGLEGMRLVLALNRLYEEEELTQDSRRLLEAYLPYAQSVLSGEATENDSEASAAAGDDGNNHQEKQKLAQNMVNNLLATSIGEAKLLDESGRHGDAAELYEKALEIAPSHTELIPRIVDSYIAADRVAKAKVVARQAREEYPQAAGTWIATGTLAEKELRYREAVDAFLKAKQLGHDQPDLDLKIGDLYMKLGESQKAQPYLAAGVSAKDAPPEVVYNYAVSLMQEKKFAQAIVPLQNVTESNPDMVQAWQALALSLRMSKRYTEAVAAYEKALSFMPDPKLLFNLGLSQSRAGMKEEAVTSYREAIVMDPNFKEAHYNLARTLMSLGRYEEALVAMDEHLKVEPDSYRIFFNQGFCLYNLGRYDEAIEKYGLALEQKETSDVLNNIGLAYDKLGEKETAQAFYREAKGLKGGGR